MKHQALFSSKDKSKELKCRLLQFLFGALRVKKIEKRAMYPYTLKEILTVSNSKIVGELICTVKRYYRYTLKCVKKEESMILGR